MPRTIIEPFRIKSVEPIHWTTRAQREQLPPRRLLQPLPAPRRRRPHRPPHRLRHRSHVHPPVGRHHGRRRELRRQPQFRTVPRLRAGHFRLQARHPHSPGPRRRAHPLQRDVQKRRCRPQQHALRHHPRQRGIRRRRSRRPRHPRRPSAQPQASFQGQHGRGRSRGPDSKRRRASASPWSC